MFPRPSHRHRSRTIVAAVLAVTSSVLATSVAVAGPQRAVAPADVIAVPAETTPTAPALIRSVTTDRARYAPGQDVLVEVELVNNTGRSFTGSLVLTATHLGRRAGGMAQQTVTTLAAGGSTSVELRWKPPRRDFTGYRISISAHRDDGGRVDETASAVDVSSDWRKFPRYGYVSEFGPEVPAEELLKTMNKYHLNGVQFYDWHWKHHQPYSPAAVWPDVANRPIHRSTVQDLIAAAHRRGMVAMNYNLAYGGFGDYDTDGSGVQQSWGLFRDATSATKDNQDYHPLPSTWATDRLYLFDPANPDWRRHLFSEQRKVEQQLGFDGWHIDTIGNRGPRWNGAGQEVSLADEYAPFARAAREAVGGRVLFNTVGGHGLDQVARDGNVDFVYNEVWESDGTRTYRDLAAVVDRARANTDKAVVIPAYMNKAYGQATEPGTQRQLNEASVRLTNATILASGASHLELGDGDNMLSNEYFPNKNLVMSSSLQAATQDYYDFQVAYQNLLRDNVTPAGNAVTIAGVPTSTTGRPGTIWTSVKKRPGQTVLQLINLENNQSDQWRDDEANYPTPDTMTDLPVKLYVPAGTRPGLNLYVASPDANDGEPRQLQYRVGRDSNGTFLEFTVPQLQYWDTIWLDDDAALPEPTRDAFQRIEAEGNDFNAQVSTEPTQDTGGGQNVCCTDKGDYIAFRNVDFGSGASAAQVRVATASAGGTIEFRTGRFDGPVIGRLTVGNTGGWQQWTTVDTPVTVRGRHDLYVLFRGDVSGIANLNWLTFTRS